MRRLFTYGCSFTEFIWPTWADILGKEYDYFVNYGRAGAGNMFISAAVAETSIIKNFTKDDTIAIMWTNCIREDRYVRDWHCYGNFFSGRNLYELSEDWVKKYITIRGCYVRDLANIHLTKKLLDGIGCNYIMFSMVDIDNWNQHKVDKAGDEVKDVLEHYKETLSVIKPSVHKTVFNYNWISRNPYPEVRKDSHPTPKEHLNYLKSVTNFNFKDSTLDWVEKLDKETINTFPGGSNEGVPLKKLLDWEPSRQPFKLIKRL